ncbi:MAG: 16S rRNA (cytosine(967)-C(5))-methyltransferase RsmB, partial [Oxalobacter sp.]|nr:16S rRNA (cytosine(967)-C(5))-methyltransferase RsmB [Oxalobacter sp.]
MSKKSRTNRFRSSLPADSLGFALLGAAHAVAGVENGTALPAALSSVFGQTAIPPQAAGAIQYIAYRCMRCLGLSRTLLRLMTQKQPEPSVLRALLYCTLSLLVEPDENGNLPYEPFTAVNQSVAAAASARSLSHSKGMVNAVLRRFLREKDALLAQAGKDTEAAWNYPEWWVRDMATAYPENWKSILNTGNTTPPLTLRVNHKKGTTAAYLDQLSRAGMDAVQVGPAAVMLKTPVPVSRIPGFAN